MLVWRILSDYSEEQIEPSEGATIQREVCRAITAGLCVLYNTPEDTYNLLHKLLTEGDKVAGLARLRDLILVDFADQLRNHTLEAEEVKMVR